jgi:uncharacterized membrane protein
VSSSRLEAFSDGVLAILITIMVLELEVPTGHTFTDLVHAAGIGLLTYILSFVYIGIYWNNHHHMFQLVHRINGVVLWANLMLLFCLSLLPFTTAWVSESRFAPTPVAAYGFNLVAAGIAYLALQTVIIRQDGPDSRLRAAVGSDVKGKVSPPLFVAGTVSALFIDRAGRVGAIIAMACFVIAAVVWIVPDRRVDRMIRQHAIAD